MQEHCDKSWQYLPSCCSSSLLPLATICHAGGVWVANMGKNNTYIYFWCEGIWFCNNWEEKICEVFFFCLHNYRCVNLKYNYYPSYWKKNPYLREKHNRNKMRMGKGFERMMEADKWERMGSEKCTVWKGTRKVKRRVGFIFTCQQHLKP